MAISKSDGSIILDTKVDTKGMEQGTKSIRSQAMKLAAEYRKAGMSQSEAQKKAYKELGLTTKETEKATEATKKYGESAKTSGSTAKKAFSSVCKAVLGLVAITGVGIIALTKQAVSAYADYEQLVGGVDTLFKESSKKVQKYASEAYRTAGVSANEYMQQVTSFSASLISSLSGDTDKAADVANMALIDISDNVNKMGSSMESVTLAYQGFAKQQYMLLDNLKLGYGGTKTEMERLLRDAEALTGIKYDISNLADVYNAVHAIQVELGIAGTTALEAEETITGSANQMKASWKDLTTAIAGGGDINRAMENFTQSVDTFFDNVMPVIETALDGLGEVVERVAPKLVQTLAKAFIKAVPSLLNAIYEAIIGLAKGVYLGIVELFSDESIKKASSNIQEVASQQNAVNAELKETQQLLDGALAGFDELNVLSKAESAEFDVDSITQADGTVLESAKENAEKIESSVKATTLELSKWDEFKFGVLSEMDARNVANANNSLLKLTSSLKQYASTFENSGINLDLEKFTANLVDFQIASQGATATIGAGGFDIAAGLRGGDLESVWQGLGEIGQGGVQFSIALQDLLGFDTEGLKEIFLPIANELENLYKDLTPLQSALISSFAEVWKPLKTELRELGWASEIVTEKDIETINNQFDLVVETLTANIDAAQQMAIENITQLVEKGLISDQEAKKIIAETKKLYDEQKKQATTAQTEINKILNNAKNEKRELTSEEQQEIQAILAESENQIVAITSEGASSREQVLEDLRAEEGKISTQRLSQVIQFANQEFEAEVSAAEKLYNETMQEANTLYHDLGLIDKERYDEIVAQAEAERSAKLKEAQESRTELVKEAQQMAGDIADTVDPETGEIYSKWELLWNEMYGLVANIVGKIKSVSDGIINGIISGINAVIDGINTVTAPFSGMDWITGKLPDYTIPNIPYLAQGSVIPPNRQFMAVLGDNTKEHEVVSPLSTIKQAVVEAMEESGNYGSVPPIIIEIDGREVFKSAENARERYGNQSMIGGLANVY